MNDFKGNKSNVEKKRKGYKRMFVQNAITKLVADTTFDESQERAAMEWITKIKTGALKSETDNYDNFKENLLVRVLGYDRDEVQISAAKPGREPDFVVGGKTGMDLCIEAKGQDADLFGQQYRSQQEYETPVLQATLYKGTGYKNAFCTNYREFILIGDSGRYHVFDFLDIDVNGKIDPEKLREFLTVFSQEKLVETDGIDALVSASINHQKDITKKFYDLFDETRRFMIGEMAQNSHTSPADVAINAQSMLNRLVFIFYAEDKKMVTDSRLFRTLTLEVLTQNPTSQSRGVWEMIRNRLFVYFKTGNQDMGIPHFNGGLFEEDVDEKAWFADLGARDEKRRRNDEKFWKNDSEMVKILDKYSVNPVITNLLKMSQYDFNVDLGPNLLGHIFEKSMSALEKIGAGGDLLRKATGAYYTLENVTSYICRNTIIPYLSKDGQIKSAAELLYEYAKDNKVNQLEQKLENLHILDSACGSGAFLTKAVDVLLDIHYEIYEYNKNSGLYQSGENTMLDAWTQEDERRKIIENNLFGIDLNPKAVEIAKLSLFFKIASKVKKLPDLTYDIVTGNTIAGSTLDVGGNSPKFLKMIKYGGFDIIIGNPPYVEDRKLEYPVHAKSTKKCGNTYAYFLEKGVAMLRPGGRLGYIVPVAGVSTDRMSSMQKYLVDNSSEIKISNYDDRPGKLFDGLEHCRSSIILCVKKKHKDDKCDVYTTGYNRWYSNDIGGLFRNISYIRNEHKTKSYIPKIGNMMECNIMEKISKEPKLGTYFDNIGKKNEHKIVYHNAPQYWIRGMDFIPYFARNGQQLMSSHNKILFVDSVHIATSITGLLNSSLFYWFFIKTSNCRDLTSFVIEDFPFNPVLSKDELADMNKAVCKLMADYKNNAFRKTTEYKSTGVVVYDEFYPSKSKSIIDEIDIIMSKHYNFTEEEADYIKKFDIKFRTGMIEN